MNFGEKLKQIRKANKLSQDEIAELLFTTQGNLSQYESNQRTPSIEMLKRLIEKFDLDANWLLSTNNEITVNFNEGIAHNTATLKAENFYNVPNERLLKIEKI